MATKTCQKRPCQNNILGRMIESEKRTAGRYYTCGNPFALQAFRDWAERADIGQHRLLEPFAGRNDLVRMLQALGLCHSYVSYDCLPMAADVRQRDTLRDFPQGYHVCVTNPPWLARNSATRRRLAYPQTDYDDLYKHCLHLCLRSCAYVAALLPATFLQAVQNGLFQKRLHTYILLHDSMLFGDTDNPVCLALFDEKETDDIEIFYDNSPIGSLRDLERHLPKKQQQQQQQQCSLRFNDDKGQLGFVSFDDVDKPSIRFCLAEDIASYSIKTSSRFFTRIGGDFGNELESLVATLNAQLTCFRRASHDVFLTPFKGLRHDGVYRRRMSFQLAREFIRHAMR